MIRTWLFCVHQKRIAVLLFRWLRGMAALIETTMRELLFTDMPDASCVTIKSLSFAYHARISFLGRYIKNKTPGRANLNEKSRTVMQKVIICSKCRSLITIVCI